MTSYVFPVAETPSVAVRGQAARYAVSRIFCVGRNYAAHAREMGLAGQRRVQDKFTLSETVRKVQTVYDRLLFSF